MEDIAEVVAKQMKDQDEKDKVVESSEDTSSIEEVVNIAAMKEFLNKKKPEVKLKKLQTINEESKEESKRVELDSSDFSLELSKLKGKKTAPKTLNSEVFVKEEVIEFENPIEYEKRRVKERKQLKADKKTRLKEEQARIDAEKKYNDQTEANRAEVMKMLRQVYHSKFFEGFSIHWLTPQQNQARKESEAEKAKVEGRVLKKGRWRDGKLVATELELRYGFELREQWYHHDNPERRANLAKYN